MDKHDILNDGQNTFKRSPESLEKLFDSLDNFFSEFDKQAETDSPDVVVPNPKRVFATGNGLKTGRVGDKNRFQVCFYLIILILKKRRLIVYILYWFSYFLAAL